MSDTPTTTIPDHGEPWSPQNPPHPIALDKGVYWLNPTQFNRAVACVNACAGMADPAKEITRLKNCSDELDNILRVIPVDTPCLHVETGEAVADYILGLQKEVGRVHALYFNTIQQPNSNPSSRHESPFSNPARICPDGAQTRREDQRNLGAAQIAIRHRQGVVISRTCNQPCNHHDRSKGNRICNRTCNRPVDAIAPPRIRALYREQPSGMLERRQRGQDRARHGVAAA